MGSQPALLVKKTVYGFLIAARSAATADYGEFPNDKFPH